MARPLVLASTSHYRAKLMSAMGLAFDVIAPEFDGRRLDLDGVPTLLHQVREAAAPTGTGSSCGLSSVPTRRPALRSLHRSIPLAPTASKNDADLAASVSGSDRLGIIGLPVPLRRALPDR